MMYTPPSSPREAIECPGAPKKKTSIYNIMTTPPSSPREVIECPGAPEKMPECYGCRMMKKFGHGGENQASHMEEGGCLEMKL